MLFLVTLVETNMTLIMRKIFLTIALLYVATSFAQNNFTLVKNDSLKKNIPDFSIYSKNFETYFGNHQYTFDPTKAKSKNVLVSQDGNFYSLGDGRYLPNMPIAGNTPVFHNYIGSDIFSGVISAFSGRNVNIGFTFPSKK